MNYTIAAIIPTFRRPSYLYDTLIDLLDQKRELDEIIIVDQTSEFDKSSIYQDEYNKLKILVDQNNKINYQTQEQPLVYKARNFAASISQSDILIFLDDDIKVEKDFINNYVESFNGNSDAIVGYHINPGEDSYIKEPFIRGDIFEMAFNFRPRYRQRIENISYTCAGNFAIKKDIFFEVGQWDENIITYGDRELGIRLYKHGFKIDYDPSPSMVHLKAPLGGTRLTDANSPWSSSDRTSSIFYFALKHLKGYFFIKYGVLRAARHSFLMKSKLTSFSSFFREFRGFIYGFYRALKLLNG